MRVAVDTNILIYLFRDPNATAANEEQADLQRRGAFLFHDLQEKKAELVVPSIVVAEFLSGINPASHNAVLGAFQDRFHAIPSFDLAASAKAAELWMTHRELPKDKQQSRNLLKVDVLIIACAKVGGAEVYYSHDRKCRTLAELAGMIARDLPTHSENLFTQAEVMRGEQP